MANSRIYQTFSSKINMLLQHLQLLDLALKMANKQCAKHKDANKVIRELLNGDASHDHLEYPATGMELGRVFSLSRSKMNEQAMIDIYRFFSWYLAHVTREIAKNKPMEIQSLLAKKDVTITYVDIVKAGSYEIIIEDMAKKVFRTLEQLRSTTKLLDQLIDITKIHIEEDLKADALFYLDIRHLIIHNDTKADQDFESRNIQAMVSVHPISKKIGMNYSLSTQALNKVAELCKAIDDQLILNGLISPQ